MNRLSLSLLLAICALLTSCATCPQPSGRSVDIDALWYAGSGPNMNQGASTTTITVQDNPTDRVRIGIFEDVALQTGVAWRATVWMAAFQAAMALEQEVSAWTIAVEVDNHGDRIDGPSAGGVLTAGMMAAMTGAPRDPSFAMTGTINPDGTIGYVSGVPEKFSAARDKGYTTLGHPAGQPQDTSLRTGKTVDLAATYGQGGTEVVPIRDVYDAYERLTGQSIKRPDPVDPAAMALPDSVRNALRQQATVWLGQAQQNFQDFKKLEVHNDHLATTWAAVDTRFRSAEGYLQKGHLAAAFWRGAQLFIQADTATTIGHVVRILDGAAKDPERIDELVLYTGSVMQTVDQRMVQTMGLFKKARATSPGDLMTLLDAHQAFGSALKSFRFALEARSKRAEPLGKVLEEVKAKKKPLDQATRNLLGEHVMAALNEVVRANVESIVARQSLAFRPPGATEREGRKKLLPLRRITRLARLLRQAADANITYFKSFVIDDIARGAGIHAQKLREEFADARYQRIREDPRVQEGIARTNLGKDNPAVDLLNLATAADIYLGASMLMAQYYGMRFVFAPDGTLTHIGRPDALPRLLEQAERTARAHAGRALEVYGEIPVASRLAYQVGRALSTEKDLTDRLDALNQFWRASLLSKLAVMLQRYR